MQNQEMPDNHELEMAETQILKLVTAAFPPLPPGAVVQSLPKPVLIPRLNPGNHNPFARAWVPELRQLAVTKEDFIGFIDNLNIINSPNTAIGVVDLIAFAIGFVPNEVAFGVSSVLGATAVLSAAAMAYNGTRKCLRLINEHYFHPRKLHVKVINRKRIVRMFDLHKDDHLMEPLTESTLELSVQDRNLKYLAQWSCELSFDVPEPSPQTTMLARMAAWQVKRRTDRADESAQRSRKRAWKKHNEGKKLKEGLGEKIRIKFLDWILVQNLDEWEAAKAEKLAKKGGKET
ncbi:hypothetical protein F4810DRAFT_657758 [Camillea tinctor]|nr:hypothetical protein F4810DRAFT_657758 [Camillea tinctor]